VTLGVRTFAQPDFIFDNSAGTPPPPFIWLQTGVELSATRARAWTSSVVLGYSFIPQAYQGIMAQGRVNRLVTGRARSLTRPDLYAFVGASVQGVWGPATAAFQSTVLTTDQLLAAVDEEGPRNAFGTIHLGVDLRVGNRIGFATFLELLPSFQTSDNIGTYIRLSSGFGFQSHGTEVTIWF
jgi:hypothetical protein